MPSLTEEFLAKQRQEKAKPSGGPGGLLGMLPQGLQDVLTYDPTVPLRQAADRYIPDLQLREKQVTQKITQERAATGAPLSLTEQFLSGTPEQAAKAKVIGEALSGDTQQNFLTGFVSTAISSLPEFFGMPAPVESEVFKIQNPWTGLLASMVGPGGAYGAAFKLSKTGKFASVLENTTEKAVRFTGATTATAPIRAGAFREMLRYTPLELSRIGVGFTVWPENARNLVGDVALGTGLNFALGGAGGWLREFGTKLKPMFQKGLVDKDIGILPTFELRLMKDPETLVEEGVDRAGLIAQRTNEVLTARPGQRTSGQPVTMAAEKPFWQLEDVSDEASGLLNSMFKVNSASKTTPELIEKNGLDVRLLMRGKPSDASRVPQKIIDETLAQFGFKDLSDAAASFVYPRVVKVATPRMAGQMAKTLDEAGSGLRWFDEEGVALAKDGEGLWVFAKRIGRQGDETAASTAFPNGFDPVKSFQGSIAEITAAIAGKADDAQVRLMDGDFQTVKQWKAKLAEYKGKIAEFSKPARAPKQFGRTKTAAGDYWLTGKTDRLDLLLPKRHAEEAKTIADWAKMAAPYRQGTSPDIFNKYMDMLSGVHHKDWQAMMRESKPKAIARMLTQGRERLKQVTGFEDNLALKNFAEGFYDVMVPTARKELGSPVYAKVYGMLKGVTQTSDEYVMRVMKGVARFKGSPMAAIRSSKNVVHDPHWVDLEPVDQLIFSLSAEERNLVGNATQLPPSVMTDRLAELSETGLVSDRAKEVIRQLQEVNKRYIDEVARPALQAGGVDLDESKLLEGYILPRIYRGDHYLDIKDGQRTVWRVSGKSGGETQRIAAAIVEEGAAQGRKLSVGKLQMFDETGEVNLEKIFDQHAPIGGADKDMAAVVMGGLKRARAQQPGIPKVGSPGTLKERSELNIADMEWSAEDLIRGFGGHLQTLGRYAAHQTWYKRWYPELQAWGEAGNKAMQHDIERKAAQFSGIEGGLTRAGNDALKRTFGLGNKPLSGAASMANGLMFQMMLGVFNTSFALLNVVTPLMTVAPWISFMTKAPSYKQLQHMQVLPKLNDAGKVIGHVGHLYPIKVMGAALRMAGKPTAEERALIERAVGDGVMDAQLYENFVGGLGGHVGEGLRQGFAEGGAWEFMKRVSGSLALKSEQFSRLTAFNSAVVLGRDFFDLAGDQLYRFAKRATEQTMYGYGLTDRARIMTGPIGSTIGLFKNWQFHYINQMAEYASLGAKEGVWAPAMWMLGSSTAVGGIGATPLRTAMDGFANWASDEKDMTGFKYLRQNWPTVADEVYFGLPAMLGASLQSSSVMPGTDMVQDVTNLANVVAFERAKQLWDISSKMREYGRVTGDNALTDPNLRAEFLGVVLPRAAARVYAATEQEGIISMRSGYTTKAEVSPMTKLLYGLGLNQVDIETHQVAGRELFKQQEREKLLMQNLGKQYANAQESGRTDQVEEIYQKTVALGLPFSKVVKSGMSRRERAEGDALSRYDATAVEGYGLDRGSAAP